MCFPSDVISVYYHENAGTDIQQFLIHVQSASGSHYHFVKLYPILSACSTRAMFSSIFSFVIKLLTI
jgi:hypothetical protein